jgi:Spy/CpxP family protein refolding chaperone
MKPAATIALLMCALAVPVRGQTPPGAGEDPFARYLFPPDRILAHGQEIGLEEAQRTAIRSEVIKAQPKFMEAQLDLQGEIEKMTRLLQERPVDEPRVLAQVDRILALEKDVKKTQISLLVRIKNVLTAGQQAKLAQLLKGSASP